MKAVLSARVGSMVYCGACSDVIIDLWETEEFDREFCSEKCAEFYIRTHLCVCCGGPQSLGISFCFNCHAKGCETVPVNKRTKKLCSNRRTVMPNNPRIAICKCPHGIYSINLDVGMSGTRLTPSKCCGRWDTVKSWPLTERMAKEIINELSEVQFAE